MSDKTFYNKKNAESAIKVLSIVTDTLTKFDIKYYLDFGTLIGAVREKSLIPWDHDIDISLVNESDYSKIPSVLKEIKSNHNLRTYLSTFKLTREKLLKKGKTALSKEITFTDEDNYSLAKIRTNNFLCFGKGSTCLDIFFKYQKEGQIYWSAFGKTNAVEASKLGNNFIEINFYDKKYLIPENYDEYLTSVYGEWKKPNKKWTHEENGLTESALE